MRLVGYIRVSRVAGREGETFISPDVQRDRILALARANGHTVVGWHQDLDQPGSRLERPAFQQALRDVEEKRAEGVAVAKLDRFARSVAHAGRALERLEAAGGVLVAVDVGMDTSTPAGKLMRNVLMALAEFELDRIRENWRDADQRAITRGVHVTNSIPAGYLRRPDGRLEIDPEPAGVVRELFRRRGSGASWRELADFLDEKLPRVEGAWPPQTIMGMVARRVYLGEAHNGGLVNTAAHEPLVTRAEWEAAQAAPLLRPARRAGSLLAGIVRCAGCGQTMSRNGGGSRGYAYYECRGRSSFGVCPAHAKISLPRIDAHAERVFLQWLDSQPVAVTAAADVELEAAVEALQAAEQEVAAYRDTTLVSLIGVESFTAGLAGRVQVVTERQERVAALHVVEAPRVGLADEWPGLALADRRRVLAAAFDAVYVRQAHLRGQGTRVEDRTLVFLRGSGVAGPIRFDDPDVAGVALPHDLGEHRGD